MWGLCLFDSHLVRFTIAFFFQVSCVCLCYFGYRCRLEQSLALAIGRLVVRNYPSFFVFLSVCLIMCLAKQLRCLGEEGDCPLLHFVAATATKPYYVLPAANIAAAIAR